MCGPIRLRRGLALAVLASLAMMLNLAGSVTARPSSPHCTPEDARRVASGARLDLFVRRAAYYACERGTTRKPVQLAADYSEGSSSEYLERPRFAGTTLAYELVERGEGQLSYTINVWNIHARRSLLRTPTGDVPSGAQRQIGDVGVGPATDVLVRSSAAVAWIADRVSSSAPYTSTYEVHIADAHGARLVAASADVSRTSLHQRRTSICWTQARSSRCAPVYDRARSR